MRRFVLIAAFGVSCRAGSPGAEPPAEPTQAPVIPVPAPDAATTSNAATEPAVPQGVRPAHACSPVGDEGRPSSLCALCSPSRSEVLLDLVMADTLTVPAGATVLAKSAPAAAPRDLEYIVALSGERLIAQIFTCPGCRRRMGWGFDASLESLRALDDDNRRALQKALGFAETPLLGTADEWRNAKPVSAPSREPALPSCKR